MKTCSICGATKPLLDFTKATQKTGGYAPQCKQCDTDYRRSYKGKLYSLYKGQRTHSRLRGHVCPDYSFDEFQLWAEERGYAGLYTEWVFSGYTRSAAPSADRLDNDLPYTLNNLQLVSWQENVGNAAADLMTGVLVNNHTPVRQLTKEGQLIKEYASQGIAARELGIPQACISLVARGLPGRKTAGGFKWEFSTT